MKTLISRSQNHTKQIAGRILKTAFSKKTSPIILALTGELGAGKTTFIQGLAKALGIREKVQSPTFVLMKWYRLPRPHPHFRHLIHIDAYRIESLAEARHLGLKNIFKDRDAVVVVEWAERIRKLVPRSAYWIRFMHGIKPRERVIVFGIKNQESWRRAYGNDHSHDS